MDSEQLTYLLHTTEETRDIFVGVYASDTLPNVTQLSTPFCLIVNTAPHSHPGMHWLALYCSVNKQKQYHVEYFDPLGMEIVCPKILKFVKTLNDKFYYYSSIIIQAPTSNVCGLYVLLYCYLKAVAYSFKNIVQLFDAYKYYENDCKVTSLCKHVFGSKLTLHPSDSTSRYCHTVNEEHKLYK